VNAAKHATPENSSPPQLQAANMRPPSQPLKVGCKDGVNMRANPIRFVRKSGGPPETVASKELRLSTSVVSIGRNCPKDVVDFKSRSRDDRVVEASHLLAVTAVVSSCAQRKHV
jgi:hypothetical protein